MADTPSPGCELSGAAAAASRNPTFKHNQGDESAQERTKDGGWSPVDLKSLGKGSFIDSVAEPMMEEEL